MKLIKPAPDDEDVPIKLYTHRGLSALYGIDHKTLTKWLRPFQAEIGTRVGYYYNAVQVAIIFDKLGTPNKLDKLRTAA